MREAQPTIQLAFIPWRFYLVLLLLFVGVLGLVGRIFTLSIYEKAFLQKQGDSRVLRLSESPIFRGMIVDRNGEPLAVSTEIFNVWINPSEYEGTITERQSLSHLLGIKGSELNRLILSGKKKHRSFLYVKRGVAPDLAKKVKSLAQKGVYLESANRRYYPEGEVTAHLIGFTNIDDQGQEGLELAYNAWLKGESGKAWVVKDRLGRTISDEKPVSEQKIGKDITLSIDRRIQYVAYRELVSSALKNRAASASIVVLDIPTGEVLAMANYPSYNPNQRRGASLDALRNRAVTDNIEPGSTIKAFTLMTALDSGLYHPDTVIDTSPGWMRVGRNVVRDEHFYGVLTMRQVLEKSSNVGVTKMLLSLPPDHFWDLLHRVGFGEPTGVIFPGEQTGVLIRHHPWGAFVLATMGFGYGLSVTPLQLARAYAVIGSNGLIRPVSLLKQDTVPQGQQVISPKITHEMLQLLESVVQEGTGRVAQIPGYRVAGKTGTAQMVGARGYEKRRHIAWFSGLAPVSAPRFAVVVVVSDPKEKAYHGAEVSGPIFKTVMESTLRLYNIPPDQLDVPAAVLPG